MYNEDYGEFKKMRDVLVGTRFYVRNGRWTGEVVSRDGMKCIHVHETGGVFPIPDDYELAIDIEERSESNG